MRRTQLLIYLFYLVIAILITFPLITTLTTRLAGDSASDAYEMGRHIWWFKYALQHGQPLFFQPFLGYPDGISGVSLWADPLQFFPAWLFAFLMPVAAAYNITILLTMALNGWAMYQLAAYCLQFSNNSPQHFFPALLAGLVFTAFPTMQGHLLGGHAGLLVMWPVPLFVLATLRLVGLPHNGTDTRKARGVRASPIPDYDEQGQPVSPSCEPPLFSRRWFGLAVLFFVLSPSGHALQLIYVLMPITAWFALRFLLRRDWVRLVRVLLVALVGGVILLVFLVPVISDTVDTPAYTNEASTVVRYSTDLLAIVSPSFMTPWFTNLDYSRRVLGVNLVEGSAYVGILAALLSLIGLWRWRQARPWLGLAALAWLLSLGPVLKIFDTPVQISSGPYLSYITLPWAAVENLPVFNLARTPGRFNFVLALAVAMLAGYGAATIWQWMKHRQTYLNMPLKSSSQGEEKPSAQSASPSPLARRRLGGGVGRYALRYAIFVLLMGGILWEYQTFAPLPTVPADIPAPIADLAKRTDVRAVFDIPWTNLLAAKEALYLQTAHEKPLIAGQVTRQTPVSPAKLSLLENSLYPALLKAAGADVVIIHKNWLDQASVTLAFAQSRLGAPIYEDDRFAVYNVPNADAPPTFTSHSASADSIKTYADSHFYTPAPGWIDFSAALSYDSTSKEDVRQVLLYLDGKPVHRWTLQDKGMAQVPLLVEAGYHVAALVVEPVCPEFYDPALRCRTVGISHITLNALPEVPPPIAIPLDKGVQLTGAYVPDTLKAGDTLPVRLWWRFDQQRQDTDVRFVHLIAPNGDSVTQSDDSLGRQEAGSQWGEQVDLTLPANLAAGTYTVYAGWYTYPDLTRFAVLVDTPGARDGLVYVGQVKVESAAP